jgi:hypothetical protein
MRSKTFALDEEQELPLSAKPHLDRTRAKIPMIRRDVDL